MLSYSRKTQTRKQHISKQHIKKFNKGAVASQAQTITVSTWKSEDWKSEGRQNGEGRVGAILSQPATLPALQPGSSVTLTFTSQSAAGYALRGTVHISGGGSPIQFAL